MNLHKTLEEIRQQVGDRRATSPYTKDRCRVSMANLQSKPVNCVVLDVDLAFPADQAEKNQCDLILFHIDDTQNRIVGVPIELKSGGFNASEAANQLQGGANIIDSFVPKDIEIKLVPVLVHGEGNHKVQFNRLKTKRINFRSEKLPIIVEPVIICTHRGAVGVGLPNPYERQV